ncbi:uncharacterized protein LOC131619185 [Vicia villosa]|uniref:uncharacterized protein LOC131619185 n=1 Tax=Vicia villosa TaxID=3911 RepID=UPI00273B55F3|nr:uncharacterized protein LOC131619185 [Vicia villosa]
MSVTEYAAKFVELAKFYPHYNEATAEFSKCIKFENGLRLEIKKGVGSQKIRVFADLIGSCRNYEEDSKAHYKIMNERRGKQKQNRGKPYSAPTDKGKQRTAGGKRTSGGDASAGVVCLKCGKSGHKSNACIGEAKRCFRCGKDGHEIADCKHKAVVCFNYGEEGHIGTQCQNPKKGQASGRVFALAEAQTPSDDQLIRGINWLECNNVHINCYDKSERFSNLDEERESEFLSARQLSELMKDEVQVFAMMASLSNENRATIDELQVDVGIRIDRVEEAIRRAA